MDGIDTYCFLSTLLRDMKDYKVLHVQGGGTGEEDAKPMVWSILCMTGGKWYFPDLPVPSPSVGIVSSSGFQPRTKEDRFCWPSDNMWQKSMRFRTRAMALLGRNATYEEMFWIAYMEWVTNSATCTELSRNFNLSLVETVTDIFKMYIDFDMKGGQPMDDDKEWKTFYRDVVRCCGKAIASCFPGIPIDSPLFEVTVLTTPRSVLVKEGVYKRGLHFVWRNLLVDRRTALKLVCAIDLELSENGPIRHREKGENMYEDALDVSVYSTGLRMPGCPKAELCPTCGKNRSKKVTQGTDNYTITQEYEKMLSLFCRGHTFPRGYRFRKDTVYSVTKVFTGRGVVAKPDLSKSTIVDEENKEVFSLVLMHLASIRSSATTPTEGFRPPEKLQRLLNALPKDSDPRLASRYDAKSEKFGAQITAAQRLLGKRLSTPLSDHKRASFRRDHELLVPTKLLLKIQGIIRGFDPQFRKVLLTNAMGFPVTKTVLMPDKRPVRYHKVRFGTAGPGCTYCLKKGTFHHKSTVTFIINSDLCIVQGCWSPNMHNGRVCCDTTSIVCRRALYPSEKEDVDAIHELLNCDLMHAKSTPAHDEAAEDKEQET